MVSYKTAKSFLGHPANEFWVRYQIHCTFWDRITQPIDLGGRGHTKIGKTVCIALLPLTEIILNTVKALISRHPWDEKKVSVNGAGRLQEWFSGPL